MLSLATLVAAAATGAGMWIAVRLFRRQRASPKRSVTVARIVLALMTVAAGVLALITLLFHLR